MTSEAAIQNNIRLAAARAGYLLFRNNVGVLKDANGRPVRYGLANESAAQNKACKSSDLIGIRPVLITQEMVGQIIGQFVAIEVKESDWKKPSNEHERAQLRFIETITALGGYAKFSNGEL